MLEEKYLVDVEKCVYELVDTLRLPLIDRFYADCKYRVKCGRNDRVYSLTHEGEIIAAARLIPQSSVHFLLRNLCVSPSQRKKGIARYFMQCILRDLNNTTCYCFALHHLQKFYVSLNFVHCLAENVPEDIAELNRRYKSRHRNWILMSYSMN